MTKELVAILALAATIVAGVFAFGARLGTLTERIENQSRQIDGLTEEVRAINAGLIAWTVSHDEPPTPPRRTR